jgi:hypothetical protein
VRPIQSIRRANGWERLEALQRAFVGVKSEREEAFVLLTAVPEEYLNDVVDYFRILTGIRNSQDLH